MKNMKIIKRYFTVTKANKKIAAGLVMSAILANAPYLFASLLFSMAVSALSIGESHRVLLLMSVYFGLKIGSKFFGIVDLLMEKLFYNDVYKKLQKRMAEKLGVVDMNVFASCNKGELLNIANNDTKILAEFGTWLSNAVLLLFSFLVSVVVLGRISIGLMAAGFLVNTLVIWIMNIYNEKYEALTREGKRKADEEMRFYGELLSGLEDIRIFQMLKGLERRYESLNLAFIQNHNKQVNNRVISSVINPSITLCTEILLMVYACYNCLAGNFGIDTVLIIQSYFGTMFSSLSELVSALGELRINHVSIERFDDFINLGEERRHDDSVEIPEEGADIRIDDLSFCYGEKQIFSHYHLQVPWGSMSALVGPSGCGKSTLFHLLLRTEKPDAGRILVGNHPIEAYSRGQFSRLVTCVRQQPYLFHLTVYENFALINPEITEIRKACKAAEIDDFIMSLPEQYDTVLEENGANLSGGQRQRIAIARALLKEAKILLLDEITSALDEDTAEEVMKTVSALAGERTILFISHKKKEYERCNNQIVLG